MLDGRFLGMFKCLMFNAQGNKMDKQIAADIVMAASAVLPILGFCFFVLSNLFN